MTAPTAMPLLTKEDEQRLFGFPQTEDGIIRFCTLDDDDLRWVMSHRGAGNRLGFALQLCCLRYFGRLLERGEQPPSSILRYLGEQTETLAGNFSGYGRRYETQRRHGKEIAARLGLSKVTSARRNSLIEWIEERAIAAVDAGELVEAYLGECRLRHLIAPSRKHIDRVCRQALLKARREICRRLIAGLPRQNADALENLLCRHSGERVSTLAWLRRAPQAARSGQILEAFERLKIIRSLGIDRHRQDLVPRGRYHLLAEEARRVSVQHFRDMDRERRLATLLVTAIDLEQALLDHGVDLMSRFLANLFNRSEQDHAEGLQSKGKDIDGHLRLHADLVDVLSQARQSGGDAIALIGDKLGWELIIESGANARTLVAGVAGHAFNPLSGLPGKYTSFRGVASPFLQAYSFQGVASSHALLCAVDAIRRRWCHDATPSPDKLPTHFITRRWRRFVFNPQDGSIDPKYYEFCVFDALFSRLRAGDIWIEGSRRYAAFEDGLIAAETWQKLAGQGHHRLAVETDFEAFLVRIQDEMNGRLAELERLAAAGELPDAMIDQSGLRIGRIEGLQDAKEAEPFARRLYSTMPVVRITELLTEVDRWTGFSRNFTHLRTGRPAAEPQTLLSALLADGTNMSLTRMAEASHGFSVRQLAWMADWHLRPETYSSALATIVDAQHRQPLAARFGDMIVASSDGQHFRAGGPAEARSVVNAKYGREPGAAFYTHISGRYAPFHSRLIPASAGETPFVLGGLLDHGGDFDIEINHADTGGVSDHNFGITYLLGYRFAPRIRNLRDRRLYTFKPITTYPTLRPIIDGRINIRLLRETWDDLLRFAASLQNGSIDAATALKRLAAYPEQNRIASALRELGRIVRTLFTIDWILDPGLRRQATEELNKGEGRNNLARAVFHHRLGELRDRTAEAQASRASGLNLLTSAIILWNTVYLDRAIAAATDRKQPIPDHLIRHIAPLGWEHIILTGDYIWSFDPPKTPDGYRLLRDPSQSLLAA